MGYVLAVGISGDLSIANLFVSTLVIIGLLWTLRSNMSSLQRDRAEAAEAEAKELQKEKIEMSARMAALEARPDISALYTLMQHHDARTAEIAGGIKESMDAMTRQLEVQSETLQKLLPVKR